MFGPWLRRLILWRRSSSSSFFLPSLPKYSLCLFFPGPNHKFNGSRLKPLHHHNPDGCDSVAINVRFCPSRFGLKRMTFTDRTRARQRGSNHSSVPTSFLACLYQDRTTCSPGRAWNTGIDHNPCWCDSGAIDVRFCSARFGLKRINLTATTTAR